MEEVAGRSGQEDVFVAKPAYGKFSRTSFTSDEVNMLTSKVTSATTARPANRRPLGLLICRETGLVGLPEYKRCVGQAGPE